MNSSATNNFRSSRLAEARLWRCGEADTWESALIPGDLPLTGAHVWLCPLTPANDLVTLISPEEAARAKTFLPQSKASEFTVSRGWLRMLLAYYAGLTEPGSIRIAIAGNGKPYAVDFPEIKFSLSHSYDWAAIAIGRYEIGVDIEKLRPVPDWRELAQSLFALQGVRKIADLPAAEQEHAFLRAFTERESLVKALGGGKPGPNRILQLPEIPGGYVGHICILE